MSRIGNRTHKGRYTLSSWKSLEAQDALTYVEQRVMATDRLTVIRCVYREGSDFPQHFHPQEQLTIVEEGAVEFVIDGETLTVRKGEMISVEPNVSHASRVSNGNGPAIALNLFLRQERGNGSGGTGVSTVVSRAAATAK